MGVSTKFLSNRHCDWRTSEFLTIFIRDFTEAFRPLPQSYNDRLVLNMKVYLLFLSILISIASNSQNLVPNGSFEDANICERGETCSPSAWFFVKKNSAAGYITLEDIPASTGRRFLNIVVGSRLGSTRQYWETMLLNKLEKGRKYQISISIKGWEADPNLHDIGLYFTDSMIFSARDTVMQPADYVNFL